MNALILLLVSVSKISSLTRVPLAITGLSGNGQVAVGYRQIEGMRDGIPFYWHRGVGARRLKVGGFDSGIAQSCSWDGSVIVGVVRKGEAVWVARWCDGAGPVPIAECGKGDFSGYSAGVSGDGNWVVGAWKDRPFKWSARGGLQLLPTMAGKPRLGQAVAVSFDGSVVAGWVDMGPVPSPFQSSEHFSIRPPKHARVACIWRGTHSPTRAFDGSEPWSDACGMSEDGSTVIGFAMTPWPERGFYWSQHEARHLQAIPHTTPDPRGLSRNGRLVFGFSDIGGGKQTTGTIWIDGIPQGVDEYLRSTGVQGVENWRDNEIVASSYDGSTLAGRGTDRSGKRRYWVVNTVKPGSR